MRYVSTRNKNLRVTAAEAIAMGLAPDGGLFVPESIPKFTLNDICALSGISYSERAVRVMLPFLDGFSEEELRGWTKAAYASGGFSNPNAAPLTLVADDTAFLELWHGPTSAFKDMALQILPYLLKASLEKNSDTREVCILVATSGDTGKAALEGFRDVPGTKIVVFYPRDGVSDIQKLQMTTQEGENVFVCAVEGNFDDAQSGVKAIFADKEFANLLESENVFLSSANSINWGRLLPQIVYYFSAYCDMITSGSINKGDKINFCVPTGNFGDILAGYYAMRMGLPVNRLICASNANRILTDFFETGVYDKNRSLFKTDSPSMDILISSNLERLLFEESAGDDIFIRDVFRLLNTDGKYEISENLRKKLTGVFSVGSCDDDGASMAIADVFANSGYLMDTHTAVAWSVLSEYRNKSGDSTPAVVVSTASAYKFSGAVLKALGDNSVTDGFKMFDRLYEITGSTPPKPLLSLNGKNLRFPGSVSKDAMKAAALSAITGKAV
ncbi:MAG: threonine synthase [Clostridiales bacterium]|nr:threonine synthase [Clostridiales bacterium]